MDAPTGEPTCQCPCHVHQPSVVSVVSVVVLFKDTLPAPLVVQPPRFLLCIYIGAPAHTLGLLEVECAACSALHFHVTSSGFLEPCCKKGNVRLPLFHNLPPYLNYLLMDDNLLCCSFWTNICTYNSAFA